VPTLPNPTRTARSQKRDLDGNGSRSLEKFLKTATANDSKAAETRFKSMDENIDDQLSLKAFSSSP
jgi:hypothetical protein